LLASTLGKDYLSRFARPKDVTSSAQGPAQGLIVEALAKLKDGQLEQAEAALARARSEGASPLEVSFAQAKVSLARADLQWLRLQLLSSQPARDGLAEERASAERVLAERIREVQNALGPLDAAQASPRRALLDIELLGLQGRVAAARQQVAGAMLDMGQPEVSFALAKLDLGEAEPAWTSVVSRLTTASEAEGGLGRARSALIYALARAGEPQKARAEHERLATLNSTHPLLDELERWLDARPVVGPDALASAEAERAALAADLPDSQDGAGSAEDDSARGGAGRDAHRPALGSDARQLLEQAAAARASGDLAGARLKYEQALSASPGNLAVLSGLGGVARLEGKYQEAKGYYDQVLERNPDYVAALVGAADVRWLMGNREAAAALYERIPAGSPFHAHAQRRIAELRGSNKGASSDGEGASEPSSGQGSGSDTSGTDPRGTDTPGTDSPGTDSPGTDTPGTQTQADKPSSPGVEPERKASDDEPADRSGEGTAAPGSGAGPRTEGKERE
jgi:tetratricopeptide (TPR) repeat protein